MEIFEGIFLTVTGRIVEPDFGIQMNLKKEGGTSAPSLLHKAKSVVDENASELILGQAFEVIFKEIERYIKILGSYSGADWSTYVNCYNKERKDGN